jgi:hypothetical protein
MKVNVEGVARGDAQSMRMFVQEVTRTFNEINIRLGGSVATDKSTGQAIIQNPITQPKLDVTAKNGVIAVQITDPTPSLRPGQIPSDYAYLYNPLYILQSSINLEFNEDGDVRQWGPSNVNSYSFTTPGETRYWRVKFSIDGKNWSTWTYYNNPEICGPAAVSAGFVETTSLEPNAQVNVTNDAKVDSVDAGTTATIRIAGPGGIGTQWYRYPANVQTGPYPSGSILGKAFATVYEVYYNPTTGAYQAFTLAEFRDTLVGSLIWVGRLTTVADGGTGGTAGGGWDPDDPYKGGRYYGGTL